MFTYIVVDDAGFVREILINSLGKVGGVCLGEERSGIEGVSLIRNHATDLVFLDLVLPGMNGIEVFETLKEQGINRKFVFMSTAEFRPKIELYLTEGHLFLSKPFKSKDIEEVLASISDLKTAKEGAHHG